MTKLSIIIPVFNEEATLVEILTRVRRVQLGNVVKEIIAIDDASTDGSYAILKSTPGIKVLHHAKNCGKVAAIRSGFKGMTGDVILIQDADLEYNPNDYARLIAPILKQEVEGVYGTRLKTLRLRVWGRGATPLPFHYLGNKVLTTVTNLLYDSNLTDMETCYKVFTKRVADSLRLKSNRFDIEPEITAKILKKGYRIYEVPISVKPRDYSEGKKITWVDGLRAIGALIKYRFVD